MRILIKMRAPGTLDPTPLFILHAAELCRALLKVLHFTAIVLQYWILDTRLLGQQQQRGAAPDYSLAIFERTP